MLFRSLSHATTHLTALIPYADNWNARLASRFGSTDAALMSKLIELASTSNERRKRETWIARASEQYDTAEATVRREGGRERKSASVSILRLRWQAWNVLVAPLLLPFALLLHRLQCQLRSPPRCPALPLRKTAKDSARPHRRLCSPELAERELRPRLRRRGGVVASSGGVYRSRTWWREGDPRG